MTPIYRYSPSGQSLGMLAYDTATHDEDLNGSDKLTVKCRSSVGYNERLLWQDNGGRWREHIVDDVVLTHSGGRPRFELTCSNSISELFGVIASGTHVAGGTKHVLSLLVQGTRWQAGGCSDFGKIERIETWHRSVRECINDLQKATGGEMFTQIEADEHGVTARYVRILEARGNKTAKRQFTYGRNMHGVRREVVGPVYTKVVAYGARLDDGYMEDYGPRLTVEAAHEESVPKWGIPKADGTMGHSVLIYNDEACTDSAFLMRQARKLMRAKCRPTVTYSFDLDQIGDDGWSGMQLGTMVLVRDEAFDPPLEMRERITHVTRRLGGRMQCRVVIGDERGNVLIEKFKAVEKITKQSTGNDAKTYSETPLNTSGGNSYTGGAYGSTISGGDRVTHTLDGEPIIGTIAFTTVQE